MIKNITGTDISRDHTVKTRPNPRATITDMCKLYKCEITSPV